MSERVAAVVVLYESDESVVANIRTYCHDVEAVFVVDNTVGRDGSYGAQFTGIDNVEYMPLGDNLGIAKALNVGALAARRMGADLLLTMDQDSQAGVGMVDELVECSLTRPDAALVSPIRWGMPCRPGYFTSEVDVAITSGSLLRLDTWDEVGGFLEGLFIDEVDHEYCLRVRAFGYSVVVCHSAVLFHVIGGLEMRRFLGIVAVGVTHHAAERRYYIHRNRLYLRKLYASALSPTSVAGIGVSTREIVKMLVFEKDRMAKVRAILRGRKDATGHKMGRIDVTYDGLSELESVRRRLDEARGIHAR